MGESKKDALRGSFEPKSAPFDVNPEGNCLGKEEA